MKIRTGFVANSSSSSFIIAFKDLPKVKLPKSVPSWVVALATKLLESIVEPDKNFYDESSRVVSSKEDLQKYAMDEWAPIYKTFDECTNDKEYVEYFQESYEKYLELIEAGYSICFRDVDQNNEWLSSFFKSLPEKDNGSGMFLVDCDR